MFKNLRAPLTALAALLVAACGVTDLPIDPDPDPDPGPPAVDGVTIVSTVTEVGIGGSIQLIAAVTPVGVDQSVTWSSNDEARLTVSAAGLASAELLPLQPGPVTVTATSAADPTFSASVDLTITCGLLVSSDVTNGATLPEDTCYIAQNALSVVDGTLTVEPGVQISFGQNAYLSIRTDGRLNAVGTMANGITFTSTDPIANWRGIRFDGSRSADNQLMYVTLENGGSDRWTGAAYSTSAIFMDGNSLVEIGESTIVGSAGQAFTARGDAEFAISGTLFDSNAVPAWVHPNNVEGFATDNTFMNNDDEVVRISFGNNDAVNDAQEWPDVGIPYELQERMFINAALTLGAGVEIALQSDVGVIVRAGGSLSAVGTAMDPVHFYGSEAQRGWWKGIQIQTQSASNVFEHVVIEDGGSDQWTGAVDSRAMVYLDGNSNLTMSNSTLRNSDHYALWVPADGDVSGLMDNTFENNARIMILHPNRVGAVDASNAFVGNDEQAVRMTFGNNDAVEDAQTWLNLDVPYLVMDRSQIEAALTIEAGTSLIFDQSAHFIVRDGGSFNAVGTAQDRITFQGREALAGYWKGIEYRTVSASNRIEFADFLHGGSDTWFGGTNNVSTIYVDGDGAAVLENVTVGLTEGYAAIRANQGSLSCTNFDTGGFLIYVYAGGTNGAQATCPN